MGVDTSINLWSLHNREFHYKASFDTAINYNKQMVLSPDETTLFCRLDPKSIQEWGLVNCSKLRSIDFASSKQFLNSYSVTCRGNIVFFQPLPQEQILLYFSSGMVQFCQLQKSSPKSLESSNSFVIGMIEFDV